VTDETAKRRRPMTSLSSILGLADHRDVGTIIAANKRWRP
jgi:hypothetical protein